MPLHFETILPSIPFILQGVIVTLKYTLLSVFFGLILGVLLAYCKVSNLRALRFFAQAYTSLFRGTPLILQLSFVYFALPQLTGFTLTAFTAGVIAFSLNSAAYISEIIRGGIQAIDRGQREASLALSIPEKRIMWDIILPQAGRNILPMLVNEIVDLLKESALVSTLGEADLLHRANLVTAEKYLYFEPLIIAGLCYYCMVLLLSTFSKRLEKRLKLP